MSEFDDIFAHDMTSIVLVWVSIAFVVIYAAVIIWPSRPGRSSISDAEASEWSLPESSLTGTPRH